MRSWLCSGIGPALHWPLLHAKTEVWSMIKTNHVNLLNLLTCVQENLWDKCSFLLCHAYSPWHLRGQYCILYFNKYDESVQFYSYNFKSQQKLFKGTFQDSLDHALSNKPQWKAFGEDSEEKLLTSRNLKEIQDSWRAALCLYRLEWERWRER